MLVMEIKPYGARFRIGKEEMKTSPKVKVYARGFHFADRDAIE